jgi:hypothetical protein
VTAGEGSARNVCVHQHGIHEPRLAEVRLAEIRLVEVRLAELRPAEEGIALKLGIASYHFGGMERALQPAEQTAYTVALESSGTIIGGNWHTPIKARPAAATETFICSLPANARRACPARKKHAFSAGGDGGGRLPE